MGIDAEATVPAEERTALLDRAADQRTEYTSGAATPSTFYNAGKDPSVLSKRLKYYIPSLAWIPKYSVSLIGGDVLAGLTVASVLIPQSVSYATSLAKISPVTGLISASVPGIIYAFLGTSRQLNVAPEAATSLLVGQAVADILHDHTGDDVATLGLIISTAITLQAGLIEFLLGFFRLGFIDVVLSRALLRGFITAVAVVIMVEQLIPMFGLTHLSHELDLETTLDKIIFLCQYAWSNYHPLSTVVSFGALFTLIAIRSAKNQLKKYWFIYRIPEVLLVVIASTVLSAHYQWDEDGLDILGSVKVTTGSSFFVSPFTTKTLKYAHSTTSTAFIISIVGFLDSIVAAKQNAAHFGYSISPNRELVALGAANVGASFIPGTLPAFGSITRSRINGDVGGRTQMASLVCSAVVLLATFVFLPWMYYLPKCVLAVVITLIIFSLLAETPHDVVYYWRMGAWIDLGLMFLTFVCSIVYNVEVGIVVSLIISLLLLVHRSSKTRMTILGRVHGTDRWRPVNEDPEAEEDVPGVLVIRIRENLDFANTAQLKERLRRMELYGPIKTHPSEAPMRQETTVIVFHMADVDKCDASAMQIFYELLEEYKVRGVDLFITHLKNKPQRQFMQAGIWDLLGADAFRQTVADAISIVEASNQ
ncbi:hypothetical protein AGABI1DRAFT_112909 [Agaricus bisporus var. burnettii JB137-S8]|uniref:STAS domain-containing protein n=1 Tax=Agaricus bisporus var. burnettii (strain JB137-S8 / ATCC MYA-4627 / FGSC 10392) TaxID=597362 RepID=K5W362_AGABU|nr:uncharacterized protein AGABI1DRAFT_112909 [Agaricus bisporus var. burnettii JB137-S8]EKM81234.1 hypothetical protein AGABI1DRAFT_112909 [Agaricus bisporus var. burnettii JB137-S8]